MKFLPSVIILVLLMLFPQKVYSGESHISYLSFNESGYNIWNTKIIETEDDDNLFDRVRTVLNNLFEPQEDENIYAYPDNIQIISLHYIKGHITVNLSEEFNNFGSGSALEQIYLGQIIKNLSDMEGIDKVTLLIEGVCGNTPEGTVIMEKTSWLDLIEDVPESENLIN